MQSLVSVTYLCGHPGRVFRDIGADPQEILGRANCPGCCLAGRSLSLRPLLTVVEDDLVDRIARDVARRRTEEAILRPFAGFLLGVHTELGRLVRKDILSMGKKRRQSLLGDLVSELQQRALRGLRRHHQHNKAKRNRSGGLR